MLLLFGSSGCAGGGQAASDTGIRGIVLLGPMCPVEVLGSPCPEEPMAHTEVQVVRHGDVVATVISESDGTFEVGVPPGDYVVRAVVEGSGPPTAKPVSVTVHGGAFADVQVLVDSGIR
jgi:hypothetical protein